MIVIPDRFMLKPNGKDGLCFELHEWREGGKKTGNPTTGKARVSESGWKFTGAYPTTLRRGCELILERYALADEERLTLSQAVTRLDIMTEKIVEALNA